MSELYLSLGSNLGNRMANLRRALRLIDERVGHVRRVSSFYESQAVGFESTHRFLNCACRVETNHTPQECLDLTQQIEQQLGRTQKSVDGVYHDRTIDIDLLTYDDLQLSTPQLTLPHPHMHERNFVLVPLAELKKADDDARKTPFGKKKLRPTPQRAHTHNYIYARAKVISLPVATEK